MLVSWINKESGEIFTPNINVTIVSIGDASVNTYIARVEDAATGPSFRAKNIKFTLKYKEKGVVFIDFTYSWPKDDKLIELSYTAKHVLHNGFAHVVTATRLRSEKRRDLIEEMNNVLNSFAIIPESDE